MGADNQAEKVLDRIARLEAAEAEIERLTSDRNEMLQRLMDEKQRNEHMLAAIRELYERMRR